MDFADRAASAHSITDSSRLLDTLIRVSQTLRLRLNDWLARYELNEGRYGILKRLAHSPAGDCSQAELAEQLGQSESNISTMIERMQRDGLINRSRSQADRRKRVLQISSAGRLTLTRVDLNLSAWVSKELKGFSIAERSALHSLLLRLGNCLQRPLSGDNIATLRMPNREKTEPVVEHQQDLVDDPKSPQFALQQMLLALSVHTGIDSVEKDAA